MIDDYDTDYDDDGFDEAFSVLINELNEVERGILLDPDSQTRDPDCPYDFLETITSVRDTEEDGSKLSQEAVSQLSERIRKTNLPPFERFRSQSGTLSVC